MESLLRRGQHLASLELPSIRLSRAPLQEIGRDSEHGEYEKSGFLRIAKFGIPNKSFI